MKIKEKIQNEVKKVLRSLDITKHYEDQIILETPPQKEFGDFASNISFILAKEIKKSPVKIAEEIVEKIKLPKNSFIEKVEARGGYINFFLNYEKFAEELLSLINEDYGSSNIGKGKKYMVEFAHPNTHKMFHIGHLRNISIGESVVRILNMTGYKTIRANYQGDVGLHIAKCLYGIFQTKDYEKYLDKLKTIKEKIDFIGKCYVFGSKAYEEDENAKKIIKDINYLIYASAQKYNKEVRKIESGKTDFMKFVSGKNFELDKIYKIWKKTREWSLEYFEKIYKRVYTHFDRYYFESECLEGVDIAKEALKKGILKESQGAIIFDGEPYGLDKRVFVNSLGLPTYEAKDLKLAELQFSEFGKLDKCIHVVGPEQTSYFKVLFKVLELLDQKKYKDKEFHLVYGWVKLKRGKMSSRLGNVVLAEDIIEEAKRRLAKHFNEKRKYSKEKIEEISEKVAIGAVKYSMLKVGTAKEISFDIDESISFEGDSGPYLQYAHVRAKNILEKAGKFKKTFKMKILTLEEKELIKKLSEFPEVVEKASIEYKPNLICNYAYELSNTFSNFYQNCPVIQSEGDVRNFRLTLTKAFKIVLKNCLTLLGIETPDVM